MGFLFSKFDRFAEQREAEQIAAEQREAERIAAEQREIARQRRENRIGAEYARQNFYRNNTLKQIRQNRHENDYEQNLEPYTEDTRADTIEDIIPSPTNKTEEDVEDNVGRSYLGQHPVFKKRSDLKARINRIPHTNHLRHKLEADLKGKRIDLDAIDRELTANKFGGKQTKKRKSQKRQKMTKRVRFAKRLVQYK